jgi:hypothetical protein
MPDNIYYYIHIFQNKAKKISKKALMTLSFRNWNPKAFNFHNLKIRKLFVKDHRKRSFLLLYII